MSTLRKVMDMCGEIEIGKRDSWEEYFMSLTYIASLRATCGSRRVGAVIVNGVDKGKRKVMATGYNGNPPEDAHCYEGGCPRFQARKDGLIKSGEYNESFPCYAIHAEANAIDQMARLGIATEGCVLFTTTFPCRQCAERILNAGIKKVFYAEGYPDEFSRFYLERYKVEVEKIDV